MSLLDKEDFCLKLGYFGTCNKTGNAFNFKAKSHYVIVDVSLGLLIITTSDIVKNNKSDNSYHLFVHIAW